jgi:hypothetical protein
MLLERAVALRHPRTAELLKAALAGADRSRCLLLAGVAAAAAGEQGAAECLAAVRAVHR